VIDGRPYVTVRDLVDGRVDVDNAAKISEDDFNALERNGCRPRIGDILFSKDGTVGKVALVERDDFVVLSSLAYSSTTSERSELLLVSLPQFCSWCRPNSSKFAGAALRRITLDVIVDLVASVPPPDEQRAIAAFLDRETARIDALVGKKERFIELIQEQRTALITRAVTKGLDPNVPMKDSGVEWLGEIPAHWDTSFLDKLVDPLRRITYGIVQPGEPDPDGILMVRGRITRVAGAGPRTSSGCRLLSRPPIDELA
jgi:type I restriction enzyme, S subunit